MPVADPNYVPVAYYFTRVCNLKCKVSSASS
jgi:hypothetical protein